MKTENKTSKLSKLLEKTVDEKNGNRIRHLTRIISKAYSKNPKHLKKYFNASDDYIAGIATSAYNLLTKEIEPMQEIKFGGLGAILNEMKKGLEFSQSQLWFSKNSEFSLWYSKNSGNSLKGSENSGNSLWNSKNSGNSLVDSKNSRNSLWYSENSGDSLWYSENSGDSLWCSENSGNSLVDSKNSERIKRNLRPL